MIYIHSHNAVYLNIAPKRDNKDLHFTLKNVTNTRGFILFYSLTFSGNSISISTSVYITLFNYNYVWISQRLSNKKRKCINEYRISKGTKANIVNLWSQGYTRKIRDQAQHMPF